MAASTSQGITSIWQNIACKSSIHHLFDSYITYKHHKIITNHLNHRISSLQIMLNIIKKSLKLPQGHLSRSYATTGRKQNRFQVLTELAMASGIARLAGNWRSCSLWRVGLLASRALRDCSLWRVGLLASRAI